MQVAINRHALLPDVVYHTCVEDGQANKRTVLIRLETSKSVLPSRGLSIAATPTNLECLIQ